MIPPFNKNGSLPRGIYSVTIQEFESRFVYSIKRKQLYEGLKKLIADLKKINCQNIFIDGSYVTNKRLPGDIDLCWDNNGIDLSLAKKQLPILFDLAPPRKAQKDAYDCDILPAYIIESSSGLLFINFFQLDKEHGGQKGIIHIKI